MGLFVKTDKCWIHEKEFSQFSFIPYFISQLMLKEVIAISVSTQAFIKNWVLFKEVIAA